jgi:uncharacterized membrane protein YoaK (UPF0700 family)
MHAAHDDSVCGSNMGTHGNARMTTVRLRPERVNQAFLLAAVGGFLDAYTFVGYAGVFANSQTGNIVIFGADATTRRWHNAALHLPAIGAFILGVGATELLASPPIRRAVKRPTRLVLACEILVLGLLGVPLWELSSVVVTAAVAFVASLQVSTFHKVGGMPYSSTLTTTNLRRVVSSIFAWLVNHKSGARDDSIRIAAIIAAFAGGAAVGALATTHMGGEASWLAAAILIAVLALIWRDTNVSSTVGQVRRAI